MLITLDSSVESTSTSRGKSSFCEEIQKSPFDLLSVHQVDNKKPKDSVHSLFTMIHVETVVIDSKKNLNTLPERFQKDATGV